MGERCAETLASGPLPPTLRPWEDFMWQRSPFKLGAAYPVEGVKQSPGLDLTETYWMARYYGFIEEGDAAVLGWRSVGGCE